MKRLTERKENGAINVRYATEHETAIHRLAAIEDILGDEYDRFIPTCVGLMAALRGGPLFLCGSSPRAWG